MFENQLLPIGKSLKNDKPRKGAWRIFFSPNREQSHSPSVRGMVSGSPINATAGPAKRTKWSWAFGALVLLFAGGCWLAPSGSLPAYKMIPVKGGTFTMGCTAEQGGDCHRDEMPAHSVTLSDYSIGETEVTQALWVSVMGHNPSDQKGCDNCPVENVSWEDVQVFIRKLNRATGKNYRLPTEAEWEYAARGGSQSRGYKYSGSNALGEVAWEKDNSSSQTHPVKEKKPNELGLYDMSGNLWEWCSDWYGDYSPNPATNPEGPDAGSSRVVRGGCWIDLLDCRVSMRYAENPSYRYNAGIGFRLAAD